MDGLPISDPLSVFYVIIYHWLVGFVKVFRADEAFALCVIFYVGHPENLFVMKAWAV
jgi:hypothetical protein